MSHTHKWAHNLFYLWLLLITLKIPKSCAFKIILSIQLLFPSHYRFTQSLTLLALFCIFHFPSLHKFSSFRQRDARTRIALRFHWIVCHFLTHRHHTAWMLFAIQSLEKREHPNERGNFSNPTRNRIEMKVKNGMCASTKWNIKICAYGRQVASHIIRFSIHLNSTSRRQVFMRWEARNVHSTWLNHLLLL